MTAPGRPRPPLIEKKAVSPLVYLRDRLLTLAAWGVTALLVHNSLVLVWDFLRPPVFRFTHSLPSWQLVLGMLLHYELELELLALWVLGWGLLFSVRRRRVKSREPATPEVRLAELAAATGVPERTLSAMSGIKLLEVEFGEGGRIAAVRAWKTVA